MIQGQSNYFSVVRQPNGEFKLYHFKVHWGSQQWRWIERTMGEVNEHCVGMDFKSERDAQDHVYYYIRDDAVFVDSIDKDPF